MTKQYYDYENDSFWILFETGVEQRFEEFAPGINVEFGKGSKVLGIEILDYSKRITFNSEVVDSDIQNYETEFVDKKYDPVGSYQIFA